MWNNVKFYLLAYAVMVASVLMSTGLQLLAAHFPTGHPASTLATNLSGITVGGLIMVIGFLRDQRLEEERERTKAERERVKIEQERVKAEQDRVKAEQERTKAEQERADRERERADRERARADDARERAEYAVGELNRLRNEYETATRALIQKLEELNGHALSGSD